MKKILLVALLSLLLSACVVSEKEKTTYKYLDYELVRQEFQDSTVYYRVIDDVGNIIIIDTCAWKVRYYWHSGKTENKAYPLQFYGICQITNRSCWRSTNIKIIWISNGDFVLCKLPLGPLCRGVERSLKVCKLLDNLLNKDTFTWWEDK